MDNGTMVETFKFLNYCQLVTSSLVSKRFWNLIRTHRHKLTLLDVNEIFLNSYTVYRHQSLIKMFDKELSPEEYNEWIFCNGHSQQVPSESQIDEKEKIRYGSSLYEFRADVYQHSNHCHDINTTIFMAEVELKDETWPLFQHFIRLIMDPFISIHSLSLYSLKDIFSLLAERINKDRNRLQCKQLSIRFNSDTQKFVVWIKDHVRCNKMLLDGFSDSNYDDEYLDFFMTASLCTSAINVINYDLSKVMVDLVQKFMGLNNSDEYQLVESIRGDVKNREVVKEFKRNCVQFITEEEQYEEGSGERQVNKFTNNDIKKKLTLDVKSYVHGASFSIKITNL